MHRQITRLPRLALVDDLQIAPQIDEMFRLDLIWRTPLLIPPFVMGTTMGEFLLLFLNSPSPNVFLLNILMLIEFAGIFGYFLMTFFFVIKVTQWKQQGIEGRWYLAGRE